ncbi:alternative ribosome rescue factor ArfA [Halomonas chromatireducens]|uniref:Alternative ribosome-rescue factor A n=1 Tax=Halomonas chromatireducens TaxID=507626 RepID=A0A0X8HDX3_9GAMM|nr:alternative ribosome rescue factor ArfA [Halomonas chromatireducens]AMD00841.1 Alternative ribosome-rescue factor A [Halomonas chromatireducens]
MKKVRIRDNALKAQMRTPMFRTQQQKPKKGKGSYSRKRREYRQAA